MVATVDAPEKLVGKPIKRREDPRQARRDHQRHDEGEAEEQEQQQVDRGTSRAAASDRHPRGEEDRRVRHDHPDEAENHGSRLAT